MSKGLNSLIFVITSLFLGMISLVSADVGDGDGFGCFGGDMMYGSYGLGGMFFGWIFWILVLVALVLLIVWLIKQVSKK